MYFTNNDISEQILKRLNNEDKVNFMQASICVSRFVLSTEKLLGDIKLNINSSNQIELSMNNNLDQIPFKNLSIAFDSSLSITRTIIILKKYENSIENLEIKGLKAKKFKEYSDIFISLMNLKSINLENCDLKSFENVTLPVMSTLNSITLNKCSDNVFKIFTNQTTIKEITVINENFTFNGFDHESFNKIMKNCPSCQGVTFKGSGTASFFDRDEFDFKIKKLDTTLITFHWFLGIRNERTDFLKSQQGHLKDLTIHQLPNDFDGGRTLKFILEKMNLDNFYLGKIALISKGEKQKVLEFEASEIQVSSLFEMFRQYSTIKKLKLTLNQTDIASDEIESIVDPCTDLFDNLEDFELIDLSKNFGIFGVFLGLLKNFRNVKRVSIKTEDRNLNTILGECLPEMSKLEELKLTLNVEKSTQIVKTIEKLSPRLNKLFINGQLVNI